MKQVIPFVKDINLGSKISEITSIALEHNLKMENNDSIVGTFTISGKYKINEISINEEEFEKDINFDITLDDKYDASKLQIDIDDFYYEIINDEFLRVHIDVLIDNLIYMKTKENIEKPNEIIQEISHVSEELLKEDVKREEERCIEKEDDIMTNLNDNISIKQDNNEVIKEKNDDITKTITSNFLDKKEDYVTYKVHIIRENETIKEIEEKYNISKEELEKYNVLDNIVLGTKIIIPLNNE